MIPPICNGLFNLTGLEEQLWFAVELDVHLTHKRLLLHIRVQGRFKDRQPVILRVVAVFESMVARL